MEEELNEQAIKLMDEIFPLGHDCAPIADENYPKRQGFVRGFKEAIKLVKNNGVLDDVRNCDCLEEDRVEEDGEIYCLKCNDKRD